MFKQFHLYQGDNYMLSQSLKHFSAVSRMTAPERSSSLHAPAKLIYAQLAESASRISRTMLTSRRTDKQGKGNFSTRDQRREACGRSVVSSDE